MRKILELGQLGRFDKNLKRTVYTLSGKFLEHPKCIFCRREGHPEFVYLKKSKEL
jgi:hypothetical protein